MKLIRYNIDFEPDDYQSLINNKSLLTLYKRTKGFTTVVKHIHKPTEVVVNFKKSRYYIVCYAESDSSEAMDNFKSHLSIIGIS